MGGVSATLQHDILSEIDHILPAHGVFTTFAYVHALWSPPSRRLRRALHARFDEVLTTRTVLANLPPAVVHHCRRPLRPPLITEPVTAALSTM